MIFNNDRFYLFENCKPIKGASNNIICDLQRKDFSYISNELYALIIKHHGKTLKELLLFYKKEKLIEYFDFLKEHEYIHIGNYKNLFPRINHNYYDPSEVNNCVIDLSYNFDIEHLQNLAIELEKLLCKNLEIRFYCSLPINSICKFLNFLEENELFITNVGFVFSNRDGNMIIEDMKKILINYPRISYLIVFESNNDEFIPPIRNNNTGYIVLLNNIITTPKSCGNISSDYFVCNMEAYTESINHNTCFHKKISIDIDGNIKNCPSMSQSFGNIKDTTLEEALNHKDFKKYWNLTTDKIEVCKDCEFRYICTDCRAYTEKTHTNEEGLDTSKPLKCGYNPYTGEWEEWSTNPLKQKAIQFYGMQDLIKRNEN